MTVIFDIDGTLVDSTDRHHGIIGPVFLRHGLDVFSKPWADYRHYTDRAVLDELSWDVRGRAVTAAEIALVDDECGRLLAANLRHEPLAEIAGAALLLERLRDDSRFSVRFATGSMRGMAEVKLASLGVDPKLAAMVTSTEFATRTEIVEAALRLPTGADPGTDSGPAPDIDPVPDRVVILGDGRWDEITAELLHIPLVAVESGIHRFGDGPVLTVPNLLTVTPQVLDSLARALPRKIGGCVSSPCVN